MPLLLGVPVLFIIPENPQTDAGQAALFAQVKSLAVSSGNAYYSIADRWGRTRLLTGRVIFGYN